MNAQAFKEQIRQQGCWVFGTGFIASMFGEALEAHDLKQYVNGYLVSRPSEQQSYDGDVQLQRQRSGVEQPHADKMGDTR